MKDGISVINKLDSGCHANSYVSETKLKNLVQFSKALGGVQKMSDICFLQVRGQNQLTKEIEEMKSVQCKQVDFEALHRNEVTQEIEGHEDHDQNILQS